MGERSPARPHRVLYVQHAADMYGASRALLHLIGALDRERYTPLVTLPADGPLVDALRELGVETIFAPYLQTLWGHVVRSWRVVPFGLRMLPAALAARSLIRRYGIDLVHSNLWTVLTGAAGARLAGVPHVWHVREILPRMGGLKPALVELTLRSSRRVVCISQAVADQFAGHPGAWRVRVVYDGLPLGQGSGVRGQGLGVRGRETANRDWGTGERQHGNADWGPTRPPTPGEVVVGVVGRLHPQKGQAELLRAYAALAPDLRAGCRLLFAGSTSPGHEAYAGRLAALARELGIAERVEFLGFVERARELAATFDILALPATRPEGLGGVLLEAMAAGVPVVATRTGGIVEVVEHGSTGLLVPPDDLDALSDALAQLIRDTARRRAMGAAGRHAVERRFSAARMASEIMELYQQVLAERR
jgi:glycosyltransferase involved in cell wall biosynthesis